MYEYKRLTLLCGHYGSGKTNIAVNMAFDQRKKRENVCVADLDIVNPYYRSKDSEEDFNREGIRLICSEFASSNVDLPSLPDDLYAITDYKSMNVLLDIGGDERGALALGRLSPLIIEENDYDMLLVVNMYRPLTRDAVSVMEVKKEIEDTCHINFTGIINNSNLGEETTPETVLKSLESINELSKSTGLPVVMTTVKDDLLGPLEGKISNLFGLKLQAKPI